MNYTPEAQRSEQNFKGSFENQRLKRYFSSLMSGYMLEVKEHKDGRDMYAFATDSSSQNFEKSMVYSNEGSKGWNLKYANPAYYYQHKEAFSENEIRRIKRSQEQLEKQLNQYTHRVSEARNKHFDHGQRLSHNTHRLALQNNSYHNTPGSGMRAVFLGGSESRTGSGGTGVFLPRGSGESHKKSGCSTVLIPARVAQALKLHFGRISSQSRPEEGGALTGGKNSDYLHQNNKHEISLPEEWTY